MSILAARAGAAAAGLLGYDPVNEVVVPVSASVILSNATWLAGVGIQVDPLPPAPPVGIVVHKTSPAVTLPRATVEQMIGAHQDPRVPVVAPSPLPPVGGVLIENVRRGRDIRAPHALTPSQECQVFHGPSSQAVNITVDDATFQQTWNCTLPGSAPVAPDPGDVPPTPPYDPASAVPDCRALFGEGWAPVDVSYDGAEHHYECAHFPDNERRMPDGRQTYSGNFPVTPPSGVYTPPTTPEEQAEQEAGAGTGIRDLDELPPVGGPGGVPLGPDGWTDIQVPDLPPSLRPPPEYDGREYVPLPPKAGPLTVLPGGDIVAPDGEVVGTVTAPPVASGVLYLGAAALALLLFGGKRK